MRISDWSSDVCSSDLILNFRASTIGLRSNKIITTVCSGYPLRCSHLGGTSMFQNSTILETSLCGDNKPRFFDLNCSFEEVCAAITTSPHDTLLRTIKSPEDKCPRSFTRSRCKRSEESRVGKECVSTFRYRWS